MKILQIHNDYQIFGGEAIVVENEKTLLESHGNEVIQFIVKNDEIKAYGFLKKISFLKTTIYSKNMAQKIEHLIKKEKPDIAHIHNVFPLISPSAYITCQKLNIPVIQTVHNFRFLCPNGLLYIKGNNCEKCISGNYFNAVKYTCYKNSKILSGLYAFTLFLHRKKRTFYDKIDRLICLSEFSKQKMIEGGFDSSLISVKPNFIIKTDEQPQKEYKIYDVLFMGRLSEEKGIYTFLESAKKLKHITFSILGSGSEEFNIKEFIRSNNLKNVELHGFQKGAKKDEILKLSRILVFPSILYETFGLVAIEAYQFGLPVIGSRIGSISEIIENGKTGFLFEPGNSDDLAKKIDLLLTSPKKLREFGRNAHIKYYENYSSLKAYEELLNIYENTIKLKRSFN